MPDSSPMLVRASLGSDKPSCRTEASNTTKSCTAPARQAPTTIQMKPGRKPPLRRQHWPNQRPRSGNGRKVVPE